MATPITKISKGAIVSVIEEGNIKFRFGWMIHPYSRIIIEECVLNQSMPKNKYKSRKRRVNLDIYR